MLTAASRARDFILALWIWGALGLILATSWSLAVHQGRHAAQAIRSESAMLLNANGASAMESDDSDSLSERREAGGCALCQVDRLGSRLGLPDLRFSWLEDAVGSALAPDSHPFRSFSFGAFSPRGPPRVS